MCKALLFSCLATIVAGAAPQPAPLLSESDLPVAQVLPPPPIDSSVQHRAEVAELALLERGRTGAQLAAARADDAKKDASIFAPQLGSAFALERLPETARLMLMVRVSEKAEADRAKAYFRRPRPWIANPNVRACSREDAPLTSYPSGHTTMAFSMGSVLARLVPARARLIMRRAAQFGESRLICEMHFRSDVSAGEALGELVAEKLMEKPAFEWQFERAQAELTKAGIAKRH